MTELPRSRALLRLDGPGHIMPVEPVTPPDSKLWRVIHFPVMLAVVALAMLFAAAFAIGVLGVGFRSVAAHLPLARFFVPLFGAMMTVVAYILFVRIVERRSEIQEFDTAGWFQELGLSYCGGLLLSFASFAVLSLLGIVRVIGFNPPGILVLPFVIQISTAIILEIIICGIGFRLVERWVGSWLALLATVVFFGLARLLGDSDTLLPVIAVALEAGLLFAAMYMVTRRLWAAIGLSAAWKFAQIALYGVAITENGPRGFVVSILDGPNWLTGGQAGADASLPAICVNALVFVALLAVAVHRGRIVRPVWQRGRRPVLD